MVKETRTQKSFRDHFEVIIRRRWFLIIPLAGILFVSLAVCFFIPSIYEAHATLRINDPKMIPPIVEEERAPEPKNQVDALYKESTSWPRLVALIGEFKMADPSLSQPQLEALIADLRKRISVTVKDRNVIDISFQDSRAETAQKVANSIAHSFISDSTRSKKEEAKNAIAFINEQLKIYRQKLGDSARGFSSMRIEEELRVALSRKRMLESQMANLRRTLPSRVRPEQNPAIARLQTYLAEQEMELSRLMMDAKETHPRVVALRNEIARVKGMLDAEIRKDSVRESIASNDPQYLQAEQDLKNVNIEIAELEKRRTELAGGAAPEGGGGQGEDLSALDTGRKVDEDIYRMLLKQLESIYVSDRLGDTEQGSAFTVIEYARKPVIPVKPNKLAIAFGGLFFGMLAGLGSVFLMEHLDRSFRTSEDAKKFLRMQFLGAISKIVIEGKGKMSSFHVMNNNLKAYLQRKRLFSGLRFVTPHIARVVHATGISPQVVIHHEPKCPVSEEYRILRTNVHGLNYESIMKTVMLTSSVRGEGKSTTSANLAISIADTGKETLLIDADLRRGCTHELLSLPQSPGLADVLGRGISLETAFHETKIRNLTVITCGSRPSNPSELLGSKKMEHLLESCRTRFEMIIVDAPPVLNLPDACILGKNVDGVMFVVQAERTQREDVVHAQSMLMQAHSNIVGFVLTNVQYHIPKYVYDYLYGT